MVEPNAVILEDSPRCAHSAEFLLQHRDSQLLLAESQFTIPCFHCSLRLRMPSEHPDNHCGFECTIAGERKIICLACDRDKFGGDSEYLPLFLQYETSIYLSMFTEPEFGRGRLQGRLIGESIRAQVLSLYFPIRRRATAYNDDEYLTYELPDSPASSLPSQVINQDTNGAALLCRVATEENEKQDESTVFTSEELRQRQGVCPLQGNWLEVLSGQKRYKTIIGVHFATGNEKNFENTLRGLIENQQEQCTNRTKKSLAIVFIDQFDYQWRADSPLFAMLRELRLYDDDIAKDFLRVANQINDKLESNFAGMDRDQSVVDVVLAFESTLNLDGERIAAKHTQSTFPPCIDVLLVLKPSARGMLHSHLWLMSGFCYYLNPTFVITMDIDVEPLQGSLDALASHLQENRNIAAVCGELEIRTDGSVNIISGAQWFEFKMSYIMSKSVENLYGYVSALSPAFTMYRWKILKNVLKKYFEPFVEPEKLSWTISNLYSVAPERILSDILVNCREKGCYRVEFTKKATAFVGSILSFQQFLKSKWQLVSGQWFYVLSTLSGTIRWPHGMGGVQKLTYILFRVYFYLAMVFSYLSVAGVYLALSILARSTLEKSGEDSYRYNSPTGILQVLYLLMFVISLLISISRSVERLIEYWKIAMLIYGLLAVFFFSMSVLTIYNSRYDFQLNMILGCIGLVAFMLFPTLYTWAPIKSMIYSVCYMVMIPSYINILTAISITKTDEFMWTQALPNNTASKLTEFSRNRTLFINLFVILNVLIGGVLDYQESKKLWPVSYLLLGCSVGFLGIPLLLLLAYKVARCFVWVCSGVKSVGACIGRISNGE